MSGYGDSHTHQHYEVYGAADEHHRHYDDERQIEGLRQDVGSLRYRVSDLEDQASEAKAEAASAHAALAHVTALLDMLTGEARIPAVTPEHVAALGALRERYAPYRHPVLDADPAF